jgi:hypothetical protein
VKWARRALREVLDQALADAASRPDAGDPAHLH